jgi:hypothetical protein
MPDADMMRSIPNDTGAKGRAIEVLAEHLHWEMERMDPTDDDNWAAMSEFRRDFYRLCVRSLLSRKDLILTAPGLRHLDSQR